VIKYRHDNKIEVTESANEISKKVFILYGTIKKKININTKVKSLEFKDFNEK
jgi:hypothetical protein|tara:strand:- start:250 stop:405 length:156 start_codon:yes stop_codon:yes gene_type:complete